jgi:sarcosine oxidase
VVQQIDVAIVGGGVIGASAAWWLSRRGYQVTLFEQFAPGHANGGSHGRSRIFRLAHENVGYVRAAQLALQLWRELEEEAGVQLLYGEGGGLDFGDERSVDAVVAALSMCGVEFERLSAVEAASRWPMFNFRSDVCFQPEARCLAADQVVKLFYEEAVKNGARLLFGESVVLRSHVGSSGIEVIAADEAVLPHVGVVVAAGAWTDRLLADFAEWRLPPIAITEEVVFHFPALPETMGAWPTFIDHGRTYRYGLRAGFDSPDLKVAEHRTGRRLLRPEERTGEIPDRARRRMRQYVVRSLPGLEDEPGIEYTCLYDSTPNRDFFIQKKNEMVVATGFSGHGFKFSILVGRAIADMVSDGRRRLGLWDELLLDLGRNLQVADG